MGIDVDWLSWATGASLSVDELIDRNLTEIAANYAQAGIETLVLARAVLSPLSMRRVRDALRGWQVVTSDNLGAPRTRP